MNKKLTKNSKVIKIPKICENSVNYITKFCVQFFFKQYFLSILVADLYHFEVKLYNNIHPWFSKVLNYDLYIVFPKNKQSFKNFLFLGVQGCSSNTTRTLSQTCELIKFQNF